MKIFVETRYDCNNAKSQTLLIDNKERMRAKPLYDCPEDATLERDINTCDDTVDLMAEAYLAGVKGKEFIIKKINCED